MSAPADRLGLEDAARRAPPETAVLTRSQLAAWLQVGMAGLANLERDLGPFPSVTWGRETRYLVRQATEHLMRRAE